MALSLSALLASGLVVYLLFPSPPGNLGVRGARLAPCPSTPNCVSSFEDENRDGFVPPLVFEGSPVRAMDRLADHIRRTAGASIATHEDGYLHAVYRTPLFGFVDDIEFLLDAPERRIHVRSASRRGYSDLGANRKRVEGIRSVLFSR